LKKHEVAYLTVRILALYSFIQGLLNISTVIQFSIVNVIQTNTSSFKLYSILLLSVIPALMFFIIGFLIWKYALKISKMMFPNEEQVNLENTNYKLLQSVAFSIVGLILVVTTLPKFPSVILNLIEMKRVEEGISMGMASEFEPRLKVYFPLIEQTIQILLGTFLLFGAKGISAWINVTKDRMVEYVKENNS
jgi:hypothetical protein